MMIVSVTRADLRDEFDMADEASTLSPIPARTSLPSEQDYDAISQALMETSRGRWFLGEYAIRNRNADTRMVLDAVTRIEETLTAQNRAAPDTGLHETLAAVRRAVDDAQAALGAAFDLIRARIAQLDNAKAAIGMSTEAIVETVETAAEIVDVSAEAAGMAAEVLDVTSEAANESREIEDDYDEALLDMVALEMAAPDPAAIDDAPHAAAGEVHVAELPATDPRNITEEQEPPAAPAQPLAVQPSIQTLLQPARPAPPLNRSIARTDPRPRYRPTAR